ncbi:MAG: hypothetical protein WKF96_18995 [Solirubrobacteraceae bacterium]
MPSLDERMEALSVAVGEPHHMRVDPERDAHVGMAGVLGNRGGVIAEGHPQTDVGVAQRVQRHPLR